MKKLLIILFFLITNFAIAQDWKLFRLNDTLCFQSKSSNYISSTIVVKQSASNPNIFDFSKSIYKCDTCNDPNFTTYKVETDFIFSAFSVDSNLKYKLYSDSDTAIIYTMKPLGFSWTYNNNSTATIASVSIDSFFNTTDSVKTILISNGDTLKISKTFGLYFFKHKSIGYSKLIGIQSKKLGITLFDFHNQKKIDVGDYITFKNYTFSGDFGFPCSYTSSSTYKIKSINTSPGNNYFNCISYNSYSGYSSCSPPIYSSGAYRNLNDQLYIEPLDFSTLPNSLLNLGYLSYSFDTSIYSILSYSKIGNAIRVNAIPNLDTLFFKKGYLNKIGPTTFQTNKLDFFDAWFEPVFPFLNYEYKDFENEEYSVISGYTLDGIVYGNIDTNLILSVESSKNIKLSVSPNPTNGLFKISLSEALIKEGSIQLINSIGEIIYLKEYVNDEIMEIDISNNPSGVYLLKFVGNGINLIERISLISNTSQ